MRRLLLPMILHTAAQTAATTDPLLIALIAVGGVAVGAVLAGVFSIVNGALETKREETRWARTKDRDQEVWLRDARIAAYGEYLTTIRLSIMDATLGKTLNYARIVDIVSKVTLVGSDDVIQDGQAITDRMNEELVGKSLSVAQRTEILESLGDSLADLGEKMGKEVGGREPLDD